MERGVTAGARPRALEGRRPRVSYGEDDLEPVDMTEDLRSGDHGINESRSESGLGDLAACAGKASSPAPSFDC